MTRPKKEETLAKTKDVHLRMNETEYDLLAERAKANSMTVSDFIRNALVNQKVIIKYEITADVPEIKKLISELGRLSVKAELEQGSDKPPFNVVLCVLVDLSVFKGSKPDSLAVMPQNLVNGFRLSAGRPDNGFIRYKFRIPHGKAPPFLHAAFARHCVCDATPYSGSVRTVPRFPAVCNARKNKGK